ncbi:hypothetical protein DPMN_189023 [Dreissena polymorpha]|uniref:Uncharacterized protein n=1 Tax=Dreissena polymorpha TaxID=45954 RepID=A0A9D4DS06_DREPO|nr:hypothetical protein DPMN_189023 [Dreissena polymorpha]
MSMEIGGTPFFNKYYNSLKKLSTKTYCSSLAHHIFSNVGYINTSNSRALKSTITILIWHGNSTSPARMRLSQGRTFLST